MCLWKKVSQGEGHNVGGKKKNPVKQKIAKYTLEKSQEEVVEA